MSPLVQYSLCMLAFAYSCIGMPSAASQPVRSVQALPKNLKLRILPFGDSITYGMGSTSSNGYRADLDKMLTDAGAITEFIGSQKSGNAAKPKHEGYPGNMIFQISYRADAALKLPTPNVVLLLAGTNDHIYGPLLLQDPKTASTRLEALVDKIVKALPDSVVLVGTLPPLNLKGSTFSWIKTFLTITPVTVYNTQIPILVKARADAGKKVAVVDMGAISGATDLSDGIHPNDGGYTKMAAAWYKAIEEASIKGWLKSA